MDKKILIASHIKAFSANKQILNDVSVDFESGKLTCLCGPNGSGKSTLMSVLARLYSKNLKVEFGEDCKPYILQSSSEKTEKIEYYKLRPSEIARKIAYMQQSEYSIWDFSVKDFVLCGRYCHTKNGNYGEEDYKKVDLILKELGLFDFAERNVHSLSGGEFQKVRLARALVQEPDFLFLDEPSSSLDFVYEPKLMDLLKSLCAGKGIGIFLIIHDINLAARYSDKIILLPPQNHAICGSVSEIFTTENLKKTFGVELQSYIHPIYNCIQVYEK